MTHFRAFNKKTKQMCHVLLICFVNKYVDVLPDENLEGGSQESWSFDEIVLMASTGIKDKNGREIWDGDILEFADKWEWYKTKYGIKMYFATPEERTKLMAQYDAEPMHHSVVELPGSWDLLLSTEIQTYWRVIGNIHRHPEKLKQ